MLKVTSYSREIELQTTKKEEMLKFEKSVLAAMMSPTGGENMTE